MKRLHSVVAGAVAASSALVAATALFAVPATAAVNLITNPGLESGALAPWSGAGCSVTNSPVHSGSYALAGTPSGNSTAQCQQVVAVSPNTSYVLSAYVNGSYVYLGVSGTGTTDVSTWTPGTSGSYAQLSVSFTTGSSTTSVTIWVHGWYGQGTYYADDFNLPGNASSSSSPSASPTSSVTPSPTPTSTSSPTPTPPATGLPAHVLTGYWQDFVNGATPLRLRDVPTAYDLIAVAFANATSTPAQCPSA